MSSKRDVLKAIQIYQKEYPANDYPRSRPGQKSWLEHDRYSHALQHEGRLYPPKKIYSLVMGDETRDFNTRAAVSFLEGLGFQVVSKPGAVRQSKKRN